MVLSPQTPSEISVGIISGRTVIKEDNRVNIRTLSYRVVMEQKNTNSMKQSLEIFSCSPQTKQVPFHVAHYISKKLIPPDVKPYSINLSIPLVWQYLGYWGHEELFSGYHNKIIIMIRSRSSPSNIQDFISLSQSLTELAYLYVLFILHLACTTSRLYDVFIDCNRMLYVTFENMR